MMRIGSHLPAWFWRPVGRLVVAFLTTFPPRHMRQWQLNYAVMTGHRPSWNTTRRAFGRWVENMMCSLQLDHWSEKKIRSRVILENPEGWAGVHRAFQEGGLVAALPHMGFMGPCRRLRLPGRTAGQLGGRGAARWTVRVLPIIAGATGLPHLLRALSGRLQQVGRRPGRGSGDLPGRRPRLQPPGTAGALGHPRRPTRPDDAPGPALLAQQGHRPLVGVVTWFGPRHRLHVLVTDLIHVGSGEQELVRASQQLADFFSRQISDHPLDWLMLQRFFRGVTA